MASKETAREFKFERWLVALSDRLKSNGLGPRLLYTDRARGDRLALAVITSSGLVELLVHRVPHDEARRGKDGANLVLLAESVAALEELVTALRGLHHDTPRLENERRKFYHRIERMGAHLLATFDLRMGQFPHAALESLSSWVSGAKPMWGIEATFRTKEHEPEASRLHDEPDDALRRREARKYLVRFAARVDGPGGPRAALFVPGSKSFSLGFVPAATAVGTAAAQHERQRRQEAGNAQDFEDGVEVTMDVAEVGVDAATTASDCGGLDLPDCDFVDVPDCGGCDCSF